ncbi:casein kinase [Grosmannia clavigera kw1407]|uniref:Casein kinase n=1 Tax=Grosmannia clavigera (strain kw1407 / UAMH 11150) TaxID=655863 RepID=F0X6W0_GROCL|nr:casein kinase [Grosmannia clavigera kw1407]EFX06699.1 casein kinase [Grosmannia clavigera kw1407]
MKVPSGSQDWRRRLWRRVIRYDAVSRCSRLLRPWLTRAGTDLQTGEEVAIKLTYIADGPEILRWEKHMYDELAGGAGIPRVRFYGSECDFYVLVHDLLGPSLEDLFNYCGRRFSLKTILLIADQAIFRIEHIHAKGIIHRDIKPDHFLMGLGKHGNTLYAIDFGLARCFADSHKDVEGLPFGGTRLFASIRNHGGCVQSWGDDLESLGYVLLYFARGSLPWQHLEISGNKADDKQIKAMKESFSGEALYHDDLPSPFATYMDYVRSLDFGEKPDYAYLWGLSRRLFTAEGFKYDKVFDWTEKRFHEICS